MKRSVVPLPLLLLLVTLSLSLVADVARARVPDGRVSGSTARDDAADGRAAEHAAATTTPTKPGFISSDIEGAQAAELISGVDDIKTDGNCATEVKQHCGRLAPGHARLAKCLNEQVEVEETGWAANAAQGGSSIISGNCRTELRNFNMLQSTNINHNVVKHCWAEADILCNIKWFDGFTKGQLVACLRDQKDKLSSPCKEEVFKAELDDQVDTGLFQACQPDAAALCGNLRSDGARIQACLRDNFDKLRWQCQERLLQHEMQNADDIHLSVRLYRTCLLDKNKFCADVPYGNAAATIDCLEGHREDKGLSMGCRSELDAMISRRVRNFRLDLQLSKVCRKDLAFDICTLWPGTEAEQDNGNVITCLRDYMGDIHVAECKQRVLYYNRLAAQDIRFNPPLADACMTDRQKFCAFVPPVAGRVMRCLESRSNDVSSNCRASLLAEQQLFAKNMDVTAGLLIDRPAAVWNVAGLQLVARDRYGNIELVTPIGWAFILGVTVVMLAVVCGCALTVHRCYGRSHNSAGYTLLPYATAPACGVRGVCPSAK